LESELPQSGLLLVQISFFLVSSLEIFLPVILLVLLLIASGFLSGSEVAFFSLTPEDLEQIKNDKSGSSETLVKLWKNPQRLLATILISNNFINIAIVVLSDFLLHRILPAGTFLGWAEGLQSLPLLDSAEPATLSRVIGFLITVLIVTFLLILFGEIMPKIYANLNNKKLARSMARPLDFLNLLFSPLSRFLVSMSNYMERGINRRRSRFGGSKKHELDQAIDLTVSESDTNQDEADILKRVLTFNDVSVKQIMKSRMDVIAIDCEAGFDEVLAVIREHGYSRIPVYKEDFDNIEGILYAKDLLSHLGKDDKFNWKKLLRKNILFVPEAKKINELLKEFQRKHLHIAIVVDEYGGSAGIVTMEDIMEEILGEIRDEFDDQDELNAIVIDENTYVFEGKTLINDVCRIIGQDIQVFDVIKGDSDSIAGMILEITGELPEEGQEVSHQHFDFKVLSVSDRRVEKIQLSINPKE
jgi:gliding motility-associated protein GldE